MACAALPEDKRGVYSEVILTALDDVARKAVEMNLLDLTKYSPDDPFVKKYKRVQAELREVFGTQLLGEAIIRVLGARRIRVSAAQRKRILACRDRATLDRWITRAARAERAQDLFAAPTRPRASPRAKRPASRPRASR